MARTYDHQWAPDVLRQDGGCTAGCHTIVTGCQLGLVSCWSPLVLGALPPTVAVAAPVPVPALEAWVTCGLNVAAGALFVVGSYVILGASSRCLAPSRVFAPLNLKDLCFWGSTCYLVVRAAAQSESEVLYTGVQRAAMW